jgi:UDP-3-O-[3-hydroxymyristoyl] glucosamine N-acyltransferase
MTRSLSAAEAAALLKGELVGDGAVRLTGVAPLDRAGEGDLSFLANKKYLAQFQASKAAVVLCPPELRDASPGPATRIVVKDPHRAMLGAVRVLFPEPARPSGIHPTATIGKGAVLGKDVYLGPHVVVGAGARLGERAVLMAHVVVGGGVQLGDDVTLYPHVVLYDGTTLGHRVIVHAGAALGCDGFGYVPGPNGHEKIPHVGRCVIGDDVEIGANTTIDRGSVGDTEIGAGTKIDNLVQIGHNCRIGKRCLLMSQVGLAGSAHVEDDVILAGQVGVGGHLTIGAKVRAGGQSGVTKSVAPGETVSGYPARPHREALRSAAALERLAAIVNELEALVERGGQQAD